MTGWMSRVSRCGPGGVKEPGVAVELLAVAGGLLCLSLPIFPNDLQAYGNNLFATALLVAGLVWHILHPSNADAAVLPQAASGLQIDATTRPTAKGFQ